MTDDFETKFQEEDQLTFVEDPTDLNNLLKVDQAKVKAFAEMINNLSEDEIGQRLLVLAIGTGGTIACTEKSGPNGSITKEPSLDFERMFGQTEPLLQEKFLVKGLDAFQLDSSQMQFVNVHDLAIIISYLQKNISKDFGGFLVIHGTDTMAEASGHMTNMLGERLVKPLVYTGAQTPIGQDRSDGGKNLREALYTIKAQDDENMAEILIAFGDAAIYSYGAQKVSEQSSNAFDSPLLELAAELSIPGKIIQLQQWTRQRSSQATKPRIYRGTSHLYEPTSKMSVDPSFVDHCISHPSVQGVAISTYGAGTADQKIIKAAAQAMKKKGIPGFAWNPASLGIRKNESNAKYPSEEELQELGFETIYMTPEFARGKFEVAIRRFPNNPREITDFMTRQYVGEIPTEVTKRRSPLLRH